jgi:hypothetical protein
MGRKGKGATAFPRGETPAAWLDLTPPRAIAIPTAPPDVDPHGGAAQTEDGLPFAIGHIAGPPRPPQLGYPVLGSSRWSAALGLVATLCGAEFTYLGFASLFQPFPDVSPEAAVCGLWWPASALWMLAGFWARDGAVDDAPLSVGSRAFRIYVFCALTLLTAVEITQGGVLTQRGLLVGGGFFAAVVCPIVLVASEIHALRGSRQRAPS